MDGNEEKVEEEEAEEEGEEGEEGEEVEEVEEVEDEDEGELFAPAVHLFPSYHKHTLTLTYTHTTLPSLLSHSRNARSAFACSAKSKQREDRL